MTPEEVVVRLDERFSSGNDVPVTQARITREEWEALRGTIEWFTPVILPASPDTLAELEAYFRGKSCENADKRRVAREEGNRKRAAFHEGVQCMALQAAEKVMEARWKESRCCEQLEREQLGDPVKKTGIYADKAEGSMDNTALYSAEDFKWYQRRLDVEAKYQHRHNGRPTSYPCRVISEWCDDPNGPYTYNHTFVYPQDVKCPHCEREHRIWPDQAAEGGEG